MHSYLTLLRGINVGGKNKVSMAKLRSCLAGLGFTNVSTYIASGNVFLKSKKSAAEVQTLIETALPKHFTLDDAHIKVLVLTHQQLKSVIDHKPSGFGEQPKKYHSDAIFLMDITLDQALEVFTPREGVDTIWPGKGVIYSQRLSTQRTKSRLGRIVGTPAYKCMTIRSWATTVKLLENLTAMDASR